MSRLPPAVANYAAVLKALHTSWTPHAGQIPIGRALFSESKKRVFLQCGRRFGKSEMAAYCALRFALTEPNAAVYIIGPLQRQSREILWSSGRLQRMAPESMVKSTNNTEMRITFTNGSFVKVDGSDDIESLRGLRMSFLVLDEYKDVSPYLLDTVLPALTDFDAPLLVMGTPPDIENHYVSLAKEAQTDPLWSYFKMPSSTNPHLKPEVLERAKARLFARGDADVWQREYEAEFIPGGKRAIFPMISEAKHVRPYEILRAEVLKHIEQWNFYVSMDPGTASVFATVILAINQYDGRVRVLDEHYAISQAETSVGKVFPQVAAKVAEIYPFDHDDAQLYWLADDAAVWARVEIQDKYGVSVWPANKAKSNRLDGISLVKDLLLSQSLVMSDRCQNLLMEARGYMLNDQGQPVKRSDHALDGLFYGLRFANYTAQTVAAPPPPTPLTLGQRDDPPRAFTPRQDMAAHFGPGIEPYLLEMESEDLDDSYLFDD